MSMISNNPGYPSAAAGKPVEPLTPEIHQRIELLEATITELHDRLESLLNRLQPILTPATPTPVTGTTSLTSQTEIGGRLMSSVERVQYLAAMVSDLKARVGV